jgi:hypothetical protein
LVAALVSADDVPVRASFRTAADGSFEVRLPPDAAGPVNIQLEAAGRPLVAFRHMLPARDVSLILPEQGAPALIRGAGPEWKEVLIPGASLVNEEGAYLQLSYLDQVEARGSTRVASPSWEIRVASLAPGSWRFIDLTSPARESRLLQSPEAELPVLGELFAFPGSAVHLEAVPPE